MRLFWPLEPGSRAAGALPEVVCACAAPARARVTAVASARILSFMMAAPLRLRPSQQARDQRDQEKDYEHDEQNLCDLRRAGGDAGEAEDRGDDRHDEERK